MKAIIALVAFLLFFAFSFAKPAFAVSVSITDFPATITDSSFNITASISGASTGTNYLKIDIFKDGTTNYFGETFNGSDWYGGSTYSQFLPINIQSGTPWIGAIQARTGSPSDTQYDGAGAYKIRLRRYTGGGGYTASEANNSSVAVSINLPTPTPIPTPVLTLASQNTPIPTPTSTKSPTPTPLPLNSTSSIFPDEESTGESVLGETSESATVDASSDIPNSENLKNKEMVLSSTASNFAKILIGLGFVFILACGILISWPIIKKKIKRNEQ